MNMLVGQVEAAINMLVTGGDGDGYGGDGDGYGGDGDEYGGGGDEYDDMVMNMIDIWIYGGDEYGGDGD